MLLLVLLGSCVAPTYYQKFYKFNKSVSDGNLVEAEKMMKSEQAKMEKSRLRFLFWVNAGVVASMQGKFEESNAYFEKADLFIEDYQKNFLEEGGAFLLNPNLSTYQGEDHEKLMINYYKALNYYQMGKYDEAVVECKRMDIRLHQLSEKYSSENKFSEDAFIHVLMGIIYDGTGDYNNAFIAYRNALEIYEGEYANLFKMQVPEQLKQDLVRTADLSGIYDERDRFIKKFDLSYERPASDQAHAVIIWNNGLGPIKDEWGINFTLVRYDDGWVSFVNDNYHMNFRFQVSDDTDLSGITWIRAVFPKYVERPLYYKSAIVSTETESRPLSLLEDVNAVSFKVLEERMFWEFSKSLLRVALKQAAAAQVSKDNEGLGSALSILGSLTESADTRNWQTLPHSIYYTRLDVEANKENAIEMDLTNVNGQVEQHSFKVKPTEGETVLFPINTMATTFWYLRGYQVTQ
ncbi:MAG: hypothetical protein KDC79_05840 [Cyclobacteriaceae bacterium]|nr:hypothetical protein [Cyclobacteriaceae bacterium]